MLTVTLGSPILWLLMWSSIYGRDAVGCSVMIVHNTNMAHLATGAKQSIRQQKLSNHDLPTKNRRARAID